MEDRLTAASVNVGFSIDSRRADASVDALQAYALAKGVARNPVSTTVASHVSNMKRDLGRAGIGRKKKVTVTTPASVPKAAVATTPAPSTGGATE